MSRLAGHTFVFQIDRDKLQDLVQSTLVIGGSPPIAPFRLRQPGPSTTDFLGRKLDAIDIVIRSVRLTLLPGTSRARLDLGVDAGVVRMPGASAVVLNQLAEVQVLLEFQHGLLRVKILEASMHGMNSATPEFITLVNEELTNVIVPEPDRVFELMSDADSLSTLLFFAAEPYVLDGVALGLFMGSGNKAEVERAVHSTRAVSFALSADAVRDQILCRSLLEAHERDPAWTGGGPTDIERAKLPQPCGTGELSRGQDGVDVKIGELNFEFREGFIQLGGKFNAEGDCWEVQGGSFSQRLYFDFNPSTLEILPRLEPAEPQLTYSVSIRWYCQALAFLAGLIVPLIGSAVLGIAAVVAIELAKSLVKPSIPTQQPGTSAVPRIGTVRWRTLDITGEGLSLSGELPAERFADAHDIARIWTTTSLRPESIQPGPGGEVLYEAPTCEARVFKYQDFTQTDVKEISCKHEWLIQPISYEWSINTIQVPGGAESPLKFNTTIRTAVPPPDGDEVHGHQVELAYSFGDLLLPSTPRDSIILRARPQDLRYGARLDVKVTDGAGRAYWGGGELKFVGSWARFGEDYNEYIDECFGRVRDIAESKLKMKRRLKPGEAIEMVDWVARYVQEHIEAGSPEVQQVITAATKIHGIAAINTALAKVSSQQR